MSTQEKTDKVKNTDRRRASRVSARKPLTEIKLLKRPPAADDTKTKVKGKIIFLDVDGVLNCMPDNHRQVWPDFMGGADERAFGLNPELILNLKNLLDRTDAKIVVSSSWRHFDDYEPFAHGVYWRDVLAKRLGRKAEDIFIGSTPSCSDPYMLLHGVSEYAVRGKEINTWMKENENKFGKPYEDYNFCIIDDEVTDILRVFKSKYVVHTNYKTGLTSQDVDQAFHILNFA